MARMKSISSINAEIAKIESRLSKVQKQYDTLAARLLELQQMKQECEAKQIMDAFRKSGKSLDELMNFLEV
ncbi:MAG: DUF4315 family protein [Lachnospiraceae bacterium]|nr:DUF4315 family protein [Lachnospiraceae bacterium]